MLISTCATRFESSLSSIVAGNDPAPSLPLHCSGTHGATTSTHIRESGLSSNLESCCCPCVYLFFSQAARHLDAAPGQRQEEGRAGISSRRHLCAPSNQLGQLVRADRKKLASHTAHVSRPFYGFTSSSLIIAAPGSNKWWLDGSGGGSPVVVAAQFGRSTCANYCVRAYHWASSHSRLLPHSCRERRRASRDG